MNEKQLDAFLQSQTNSYSANAIDTIVSHFKQLVMPRKILSSNDLKRHPVDELLAEYIGKETPSHDELVYLLKNLSDLENVLSKYALDFSDPQQLPELKDGLDYEDGSRVIAASIASHNDDVFARGGDAKLYVANKQPTIYAFPSGKEVKYDLLVNERSVQRSIRENAYLEFDSKTILLSNSSKRFALAYAEAFKDTKELAPYKDVQAEFERDYNATPIAHEIAEFEYVSKNGEPDNIDMRELNAEQGAKKILEQEGVNPLVYNLFHIIRAGYHNGNSKDYSRLIKENNFIVPYPKT